MNADRVAHTWGRLYTRGLPDDVAERRREELASDLYEHASLHGHTSAQQREVLGRVLWGIPADLSWRRAAMATHVRRLQTGAPMTIRNLTVGLFGVYGVFMLWTFIGLTFLDDEAGARPFGLAMLGGAVLVGLGLWWRNGAPRPSTVLLSIGAIVPAFAFYWMAPIFGPLGLLLIALAIITEPGRRTPVPAT